MHNDVLRVAASYLVIAWLLLQIADVVLDPLGIPRWVMTALIAAAAEGVPRPTARGLRHYADAIVTGALLVAVAVLPFENLSGDPAQEYFSDRALALDPRQPVTWANYLSGSMEPGSKRFREEYERAAYVLEGQSEIRHGVDDGKVRRFLDAEVTGLRGEWVRLDRKFDDLRTRMGGENPHVRLQMAFWRAVQGRYDEAARALALTEPGIPPLLGSGRDWGFGLDDTACE